MKLILYFLKPYKRLCIFTLLVMILDVAGGLLIPTITAGMINTGVAGGDLDRIIRDGVFMLLVTIITSGGALAGSWCCASLSARIGRDIRNALYKHSLAFSAHDFESFGTGSMITRTLNDVNVVQQSFVWCIQMVLPVPVICILGIVMAFSLDTLMGFLMIGATAVIILLAILVTRKASYIFDRLQKLLDTMNVILRENLTGVRVIRAFYKEKYEEKRM
ncbi:MAG: ABC transporter permease [Ruminococcus sp.]|jgi:ATP-binding cassette subfamily B multidrug efflux pump